ncbi:hypothetical protein [Jatrophihabitans sp.]|uniref:hypothetical protein n=1 Tax=Jatrophihabitans sp. TaxID=1932789 RepID=UPI0030C70DB1|nr:hypothetical protein [Jatrophihabitans sp.]
MSELTHEGLLDADPARALAGLLGAAVPSETLPLLWHSVYLLDRPRHEDLGPDGHPFRNHVPLPPRPGLRRMFAGGRISVLQPLRLNLHTTRRASVVKQETKHGRSGTLIFVTVAYEYLQHDSVLVRDEQSLVYREAAPESSRGEQPVGPTVAPGPGERSVAIDPPLLFQYSALTYNAHRIHYDRDFAVRDEGYPGLLVHGPLQSLLMAEQARTVDSVVRAPYHFVYRLESPLFDNQGLVVGAAVTPEGIVTHVRDASGRHTASGLLAAGA